jgi:cation diffusion facilitator family transporter
MRKPFISIYEGIQHILHPGPLKDPKWNYIVLGFAMVFEGFAFTVALKEFMAAKGDKTVFEAVRASKDPTTFTVLFEDSAAMLGLIVAFIGIFSGHALNNPYLDGAASVVIGLVLASVAIMLAYETKGLLIGEGADPATLRNIRAITETDPGVDRVHNLMTMHFGPQMILLTMDIEFKKGLTGQEVEEAVDRVEKNIKGKHPEIQQIFIEAESIAKAIET